MHRDIDHIIEQVAQRLPGVVVDKQQSIHPADDIGLWYFSKPGLPSNIQIESSTGNRPFLVETNEQSSGQALRASTPDAAVQFIVEYLSAASEGRTLHLQGELFWP